MSISTTIRTMRKNEILADLPKMSINDLIGRRTELKSILYSRAPTQSELDKQSISDITIEITRELNKRAEAEDKANGNDSASQNQAILEGAQAKRKHDTNQRAERKLAIERESFDAMTGHQQFQYMEDHSGKNPHSMTISDFGGSE